jgi:hypothetical protein
MKTTLADTELSFLQKISTGFWMLKDSTPSKGIASLIERGYAKLSPVRIGPLGIYTGETSISLTEAGAAAIAG